MQNNNNPTGYRVYVLDKKGRPLDPTTRFWRVRKLLKSGEAVVVKKKPFTIRLKREATGPTKKYSLGVDPGRENIGLAVSDEEGCCVLKAEVETHNKSVTKNMADRKEHRRERRRHRRQKRQRRAKEYNTEIKKGQADLLKSKTPCKSVKTSYPGMKDSVKQKVIRGKEPHFNNRKRPEGWQTPSGRQLIQMHESAIKKVLDVLPVSKIVVETNSFDFQKLENPEIKGEEYQKGKLYGFEDEFDYFNYQQNGLCPLCGGKIEEIHHIKPRSRLGSDRVSCKVGLCRNCHEKLVHKEEKFQKLLDAYIQACSESPRKKYSVSLLNAVMPKLQEEIKQLCEEENILFETTTGAETKLKREMYGLEKTHANDAFCIALGDCPPEKVSPDVPVFLFRRFKKKSNNVITKVGTRKYYDKDGLVAKNRHKAMTQTENSLEELRSNYLKTHSESEWNDYFRSLRKEPAKRIYTFHKKGQVIPFHPGDTVKYEKQLKSGKTSYSGISSIKGINTSQNLIHTVSGKHPNFKYCSFLEGGSLVCLGEKNEVST